MNEAIALVTILLSGLEKTISYQLQTKAPQTIRESNPLARVAIRHLGLFKTHMALFVLSSLVVFLTYSLTKIAPIANLCLWVELICTAFVFFNNCFWKGLQQTL